jgi:hypothetical protein
MPDGASLNEMVARRGPAGYAFVAGICRGHQALPKKAIGCSFGSQAVEAIEDLGEDARLPGEERS